MTVRNSKGVEVEVYTTFNDAFEAEVVGPVTAGLDAGEAQQLFDLDAVAAAVLEWHTEWREVDGRQVEWVPLSGYCSAVDGPEAFWQAVRDAAVTR